VDNVDARIQLAQGSDNTRHGLCLNICRKGKQNLRVYGGLDVPVLALQRPYGRIPIELREADELGDSILLLRRVDWRHLVSATTLESHSYALEKNGRRGVEIAT
jgi:hypothetical protein